ncbi:HlyD family secretion protein [Legionella erythra]|uniref:Coiled-coil protein n=1 Tax=Legionella erythra TaxID=448 RepID=A0A0W0TRM3_LEGER|nr:HlyD family efflux transporter periplasmic adaptor subunit [Legionella erythra]KTC98201.1 coiled-coil protein [Legionella erythra]
MGIHFRKKAPSDTLPIQYGEGVRTPPKMRWILLVLILSIPLVILLYQLINEYVFIRFSGLIAYDTIIIRAPDEGYIESLNVQPGQKVRKGEMILKFISPETLTKLKYLEKEKERITDLMNSLGDQTPQNLENLLEVAKKDIDSSKAVYERFVKYVNKGDMAELQLEEARKNWVNAQRNYAALEQQIQEAKLQSKTLLEVNYKRKILEIERNIAEVKDKIAHFSIVAPQPGTIMSISTHQDEYVSAGQNLMTIVTERNMRIIAFIDPKYAEEVYQNKQVTITFPGNEKIEGRIINTPSYAEKVPLSQINPLATRENKLIAIIRPDKEIPQIYQVFGIPVTIELE